MLTWRKNVYQVTPRYSPKFHNQGGIRMTFQSLIWRIRWLFDRKWKESTRARVLREKAAAETAGKPFRMTALRRFVMDRPA